MELYALVKRGGSTYKFSSEEIKPYVDKAVKSSLLTIIECLIKKYGLNHKVRIFYIENIEVPNIKCQKYVISLLKRIIAGNDEYDNGILYDYLSINLSMLKEIVSNYDFDLDFSLLEFDYFMKELGLIEVKSSSASDSMIHSCVDCTDLSPLSCEKAEYVKKDINEYDFITDGYQIFQVTDDENYMEKFIVLKCKNFNRSNANESYYQTIKEKIKTRRF